MQSPTEDVYREHRREMVARAAAITKCAAQAEDAVQTAFCQLYASGRQANSHPLAYVLTAVRNAAIDQKRAWEGRPEALGNLQTDPCRDPLCELIAEEDRELVRELVQSRQREVVTLHLYAGLTFQEIADELDEPIGTTLSRYRRTLNHLRELWQNGQRPGLRLPR